MLPLPPDRPSLRHQLLATAIPRLLGVQELEDEPTERAWVLAKQAERSRELRTDAVPGFARRFTLRAEQLTGPTGVGFPAYEIARRGTAPTGTLFYLHGGSFAAPIDRWHVRYVARLAAALGVRVVLPDYPLTPTHSWRDSYQPMLDAAAAWAADSPGGMLIGGDSAGGGIATALAAGLRDRGGPQPRRMTLSSPWVDLTTSTRETADYALRDTWLRLPKVHVYATWWAGSTDDLGRPEVSPALADLSGLPSALMFAGTRDLLLPGCRLLADRGLAAGWDLTYVERPDLIHNFALMPFLPEAGTAFRITVEFLRRGLGRGSPGARHTSTPSRRRRTHRGMEVRRRALRRRRFAAVSTTRVTRTVAAAPGTVYAALLDAEAVTRWRVPDGMTAVVHAFDPREGGHFRISLTYDTDEAGKTSGRTDTYHGHFARLVPDREVVEVIEFESADPAFAGEMRLRTTLLPVTGGCEVTVLHEGLPHAISPQDNEDGTRMALANLAALVEGA